MLVVVAKSTNHDVAAEHCEEQQRGTQQRRAQPADRDHPIGMLPLDANYRRVRGRGNPQQLASAVYGGACRWLRPCCCTFCCMELTREPRRQLGRTSANSVLSTGLGLFVPKPSSRACVLGTPRPAWAGVSANVRWCIWVCAAIVTQLVTQSSLWLQHCLSVNRRPADTGRAPEAIWRRADGRSVITNAQR